jgi:glycerol-3-phosphate dehydrogenase subunit B
VEHRIEADGVILASGRFLGMGLAAGRKKIRETLFDLPVHQPEDRSGWHRDNFFDPAGHGINRAGLETDEYFRPLNREKKPAFDRLFAAGSILAHQDWIRQKCGAGLSIATAYAAVRAFLRLR